MPINELENFESDLFDSQETPKQPFTWKNGKTGEKFRVQILFVAGKYIKNITKKHIFLIKSYFVHNNI